MGYLVERGQTAKGGVHFEISYGGREAPFAGIDSTAPDPYIGPNQLTKDSANVIELDNTLEALSWQRVFSLVTSDIIIGIGDLLGQTFLVSFNVGSSTINITGFPNFPSQSGSYSIGSVVVSNILPLKFVPGTLTYKNVNGVCYFSFPWLPYIIQHNNTTAAILTNYLGCAYLNELNGRLIAADIFQFSSASSGTTTSYAGNNTILGVTATAPGSTPETSAVISAFPSATPAPTDTVSIYFLANGNSTDTSGGQDNTGDITYEISLDSGSTWNPIFVIPVTGSNTVAPTYYTLPLASGITNINTIQFRIVASASNSSGGTMSVDGSSNNVAVLITTAGMGSAIGEFPYQMAWSAPSGAYSQFNPLVSGLVTGAGFNNLPDVEDVITGILMTGPTAYLLRNQGVTEVTPLNSGIQPFDFNHMWASHKGIGTIYPLTVGQYGSLGAFFSDTDMYTIGYEGINTLGNKAKSSIYSELVGLLQANFLSGNLDYIWLKGTVFVGYTLAAASPTTPFGIVCYLFKQETKEWFRFTLPVTGQSFGMQITAAQVLTSPLIMNVEGNQNTCVVYALGMNAGISVGNDPTTIVFCAEEVFFKRDITIDGIGFYMKGVEAAGTTLSCTVSINGTSFTAIADAVLNLDGTYSYFIVWPTGLLFTANSPQLTLQLSITGTAGEISNLTFGKVVLFGTANPTQRPS